MCGLPQHLGLVVNDVDTSSKAYQSSTCSSRRDSSHFCHLGQGLRRLVDGKAESMLPSTTELPYLSE